MAIKALCRAQWHFDWQRRSRDCVSPRWKKSSQLLKRGFDWLWLSLTQGREGGPQQCWFLSLLETHRHMEQQKGEVLSQGTAHWSYSYWDFLDMKGLGYVSSFSKNNFQLALFLFLSTTEGNPTHFSSSQSHMYSQILQIIYWHNLSFHVMVLVGRKIKKECSDLKSNLTKS